MSNTEHVTNWRRARSRLPKLIKYLEEEVPRYINGAKFNLNTFGITEGRFGRFPRSLKEVSDCGFEGCSAGWACLHPAFRRAGLRDIYEVPPVQVYDLLGEVFGISYIASLHVFGDFEQDWKGGPTQEGHLDPHDPRVAAGRIRRFCEDQGIEVP